MKNNRELLEHILQAVDKIERMVLGLEFKQFEEDYRVHDVVNYEFAVIGEAANNLSEDVYDKHSEVPWRDITDMRNWIIHGYADVDLKVIWNAATTDLPILKKQIQVILENL
jgi:hypothetical protein